MKIEQSGPAIKAKTNRIGWTCRALALAIFCLLAAPAHAQDCAPDNSCKPKFQFNGYDKGAKTPINTCQTNSSSSPCAWADVFEAPQNFLACRLETSGPIALCFYSGVPGSPLFTPSCTFAQDKSAAECDCYKITSAETTFSYVLINGILNKKVYDETVAMCGDGSGCLNFTNPTDPYKQEAPVCAALRNKTLFPGADLISDYANGIAVLSDLEAPFSFKCPTGGGSNLYAGCMTAPCKNTGKTDKTTGLPLVKCTCPTYDGPNSVGNRQISDGGYSCSPTPHVWSSSYAP